MSSLDSMEEPHRVTAETVGGENGDLTGDQAAAASERHRREGDYHGLSVPVHDSPYRPGMRPKVPTAPAGYGGGAVVGEQAQGAAQRRLLLGWAVLQMMEPFSNCSLASFYFE